MRNRYPDPRLAVRTPRLRLWWLLLALTLFVVPVAPARAQASQPSTDDHDALVRRIEQLEAQVRALTEQLGAPETSARRTGRTEAVSTPTSTAAESSDDHEVEAVLHDHEAADGPRMQVRGYADVLYRRGAAFPDRGFGLGQADAFITSRLSDSVNVLAEAVFEGNDRNELSIDLERILLQFAPSDRLHLAVGRYHTAIGFYNTAYHHGAWFQTAAGRPRMFAFEDDGGVLPIHNLGISASGVLSEGPLGLRYVAEVGNGRASTPGHEPVQNVTDENRGVAFNLGLNARPDWLPGFQTGVSVYRDRLTPGGPDVKETIVAAHAVYQSSRVELLNEALLLRHRVLDTARRTSGAYSQAAVRVGRYRPYARVDYLNVDALDPLYGEMGRDSGVAAGLRYDVGRWAALKGQAERWSHRTGPSAWGFAAQLSFAF